MNIVANILCIVFVCFSLFSDIQIEPSVTYEVSYNWFFRLYHILGVSMILLLSLCGYTNLTSTCYTHMLSDHNGAKHVIRCLFAPVILSAALSKDEA